MALTDNLQAYWKLDGNSNDAVGSNDGADTDIDYAKALLASYDNSNKNTNTNCYDGSNHGIGQSFQIVGNYTLEVCKFFLKKNGSPTGNIYAEIWSHSGTYHSTGIPNTLLATSDAVDVSTLNGSVFADVTFTFSGDQRIALSAGYYFVVITYTGGNSSNCPYIGNDNTPVALGNMAYTADMVNWNYLVSEAVCFYVYGTPSGKINQGAGFNGSSSAITKTDSASLSITTDFSFSAWIRRTSLGVEVNIITKGDDGNVAGLPSYQFFVNSANKLGSWYSDGTNYTWALTNSAVITEIDTWYHVVATVDISAKTFVMYVNGSSVALTNQDNGATTIEDSTGDFNIGAINHGGMTGFFSGAIDEVGIWARILTSDEVTELYNSGNGLQYPFTGFGGIQINVGGTMKSVTSAQVNVGGNWKNISGKQVNVNNTWKNI